MLDLAGQLSASGDNQLTQFIKALAEKMKLSDPNQMKEFISKSERMRTAFLQLTSIVEEARTLHVKLRDALMEFKTVQTTQRQ